MKAMVFLGAMVTGSLAVSLMAGEAAGTPTLCAVVLVDVWVDRVIGVLK